MASMILSFYGFGRLHISKITLNKSPFVSKKAREQFEVRRYRGLVRSPYQGDLVTSFHFSHSVYQDQQCLLQRAELLQRVTFSYG